MFGSKEKGISLLEILIAIAIVGFLVVIALPQFSQMRKNQVLKNGAWDIVSALGKAKNQTLASLNSSEYGVHFQSDRVIIFRGTVFSSGASDNETISLTTPASITAISLNGGGADVYFNKLSGSPSTTGTVTISNGSLTKTITISAAGGFSMN